MKIPALKAALGVLRGLPFTEKLRDKVKTGIVKLIDPAKGVNPDIATIQEHTTGWQINLFKFLTVLANLALLAYLVKKDIIPVDLLVEIIKGVLGV